MKAPRDRQGFRVRLEVKMLVLSRKLSQQILIGPDIAITVVKIEGNQVRLGIEAPPNISLLRQELVAREAFDQARGADQARRAGVHAL
jgi:carbon storage regulator